MIANAAAITMTASEIGALSPVCGFDFGFAVARGVAVGLTVEVGFAVTLGVAVGLG